MPESLRLVDLNPEWLDSGGEGVFQRNAAGELIPAPRHHGVGVQFDCPCRRADCIRCFIPFTIALDGSRYGDGSQSVWERHGDDFATLSVTPSIQRRMSAKFARIDCAAHFYITNGRIDFC